MNGQRHQLAREANDADHPHQNDINLVKRLGKRAELAPCCCSNNEGKDHQEKRGDRTFYCAHNRSGQSQVEEL